MRIAFLTRLARPLSGDTLWQEPLGGTQAAMLHLAFALAARGHEVHVFSQSPATESRGVRFQPVMQLARFARQHPLDVFVAVADEPALKLGIPANITLAWLHNDYPHLWQELPDLRAEYAALLATRCDRVIAVSHWQAEVLQHTFQLPAEHISVLPNGIEPTFFEKLPPPASPPRLIYSSVPNRGLERLLALWPRLQAQQPDLELHIYSSFAIWGMTPEKDQAAAGELYALAQALPQVFLHPPLPPAHLPQALAQASLWVYPQHPSSPLPQSGGLWVDAETFCIAALEAQAAGLPVISSARGALPETVVAGQTGLLIAGEPLSEPYAEDFVSACQQLLQNRQLRQQLGAAARQRALEQFNWQGIAARWESLLDGFVSSRQAEAPFVSPFPAPQISVIIPTYNRARNLKNCLESLTRQDFPAFEVIVCDDGSSDETAEVASAYRQRLNLRYRWQPDLGFRAAEARNLGLRIARGPLLVFLDSDLVVPPTFLSAHYGLHQQQPNVVVNSYVYRQLEPDDRDLGLPPAEYIPLHRDNLKPDNRDRYELFEREGLIEETYFLDSNALSIWRKDLEKVGGFDGEFVGWGHEDTELGYRVGQYGMKLAMLKQGAEAYHQHHSVSAQKDDEGATNWQRLTAKHQISGWYHPLWELQVEGLVQLQIKGELPEPLPPFLAAQWCLKTGHPAPLANIHYCVELQDGVVTAIRPFYP